MSMDDDLLFTQTLHDRLDAEASMSADIGTSVAAWYAVKTLGKIKTVIERNYDPNDVSLMAISDPPVHQMLWTEAVSKILNHECGHGGHWIVGLTHPPGFLEVVSKRLEWRRIIKIWLDCDGDPQFTVDCIEPWPAIASENPDQFIGQAEEAWGHWKRLMRDVLAPKDYQMKQIAKGRA